MSHFTATADITIQVPVEKVWQALTDPRQVKQYLFGTDMKTDWQKGSPITYSGEWQGKPYQDKGVVLDIVPNKLIKSSYWSPMSGTEDKPENYQIVTYDIHPVGDGTMVRVTQENASSQESADHSSANWKMVLENMKQFLEQ